MIESMPPDEYLAASYYERWLWGLERRLELAGSIAPGDVEAAIARLGDAPLPERDDPELARQSVEVQRGGASMDAATAPRFRPGDRVRVRRMRPAGHTRCPRYVRGVIGAIERVHGDDHLADALARGEDAPLEAVYAVRFRSEDLFGAQRGAALSRARRPLGVLSRGARLMHDHDHGHDHGHHERPASQSEVRARALEALLVERGLVSTDAIDAVVEYYENDVGPQNGARVIARAWVDPDYRARLLGDGSAAIAELGYGGVEGEHMVVVENTPDVHNVIVCTLCSCYPWPVLGLPPSWYKSEAYRARVVAEPRRVLAEFGLDLDPDVDLRVWDSSAEVRYLVLPERPEGTDGLSEEQLAGLVTRDSMIGVARAEAPA